MVPEVIHTKHAPSPVGPYSQAIRVAPFLYTAGQVGLIPDQGRLPDGVQAQAEQALRNLQHIIETAGGKLENVIKTTVFLTSMDDFKPVNEVYARFFTGTPPARSAVAVSELPVGALVEIEAIAYWT
jgi:2-iminobutanoate/2-iminopropanoate deaminase